MLSKQPMYNPVEDFKGSEDYCNVYNQTRKREKFKGLTSKGLWEESLSLKCLARLENLFPSLLAFPRSLDTKNILILSVCYKECDAKDCVVAVIQYNTFQQSTLKLSLNYLRI